jgi:hypothetical protein
MTTHWRATRPKDSHWREVSCREAGCAQYIGGWQTVLSASDTANIEYIRRSGMRYKEEYDDRYLIRFVFEPGQECFEGRAGGHRTLIERDPVLKRDSQVMEPLEWLDRMNDDLYQIRARN